MQDSIEVITEEIVTTDTAMNMADFDAAMAAANTSTETAAGAMISFALFFIAIIGFIIAIHWKIYTKAGREGWQSIVPFYNIYVFFQIIGVSLWNLFWIFFPLVGTIVLIIKINSALAKSFGKGGGFTVGLIFLGLIFQAILAFDKSIVYAGPNGISGTKGTNTLDSDI